MPSKAWVRNDVPPVAPIALNEPGERRGCALDGTVQRVAHGRRHDIEAVGGGPGQFAKFVDLLAPFRKGKKGACSFAAHQLGGVGQIEPGIPKVQKSSLEANSGRIDVVEGQTKPDRASRTTRSGGSVLESWIRI